ncbi:MAG: hypothetical protein WC511_01400 [Candidatus Pacearchaeota archaeon]
MCKQCETNPVYEFTNQRKLCKTCFITYFNKKVLFTLRKYHLIKSGDIIGYKNGEGFREVVLEDILLFISEKYGFNIVKLPNKKANKIAVASTLDSESHDIVKSFVDEDVSKIKNILPSDGNFIKPLYLFLDEEVLLYAKLKNMKYKNVKKTGDRINNLLNDFEKKHPEVKRAVVNSILELYD